MVRQCHDCGCQLEEDETRWCDDCLLEAREDGLEEPQEQAYDSYIDDLIDRQRELNRQLEVEDYDWK